MKRVAVLITAIVGLTAGICFAEEVAKFQICRTKGIVDSANKGKTIIIPSGSSFADVGTIKGPNNGDNGWPVVIQINEDAIIKASAKCVIVDARLESNLSNHRIYVSDGRLYRPKFNKPQAELSGFLVGNFAEYPR